MNELESQGFWVFSLNYYVTLATLLNFYFLIYENTITLSYLMISCALVNKSKVLYKCLIMIMIRQAELVLYNTEMISLEEGTNKTENVIFYRERGCLFLKKKRWSFKLWVSNRRLNGEDDGVIIGFIQNAIEDSSVEDETHFTVSWNYTAQEITTRGMLAYSSL